jgi:hypothetical protein
MIGADGSNALPAFLAPSHRTTTHSIGSPPSDIIIIVENLTP